MSTLTETSKCKDNSEISTYKVCPRSHFIRYILGWRKEGSATALIFGGAFHAGLDEVWGQASVLPQNELASAASEAFNTFWYEAGMEVNLSLAEQDRLLPRTPGIAKEMYHNYVISRSKMLREAEVLSVEQPFAVPMPGMEDVWYIGKLDKAIQYNGQTVALEHKTTTAYATQGNFRTDYVDSWYTNAQVKGYEFGGALYFPSLSGVWVDACLVHKKVHDAFKFIPVSHSWDIINEWAWDTREWINQITREEEEFRQAGKLEPGMFRKNEESCHGKYGPCPFIDICRTTADPSKLNEPPPGFIEERWEPFDKLHLAKLINEKTTEETKS